MMRLVRSIEHFFFAPISASGFGLMRIAWALVVLIYGLPQMFDAKRIWSEAGLIPADMASSVFRSEYRYTILEWVTEPNAVLALYVLMMVMALFMVIGLLPKFSTIVAVLLMFSFHERNTLLLGGGDTVLRNLGFILMLAPVGAAFSLKRGRLQWQSWKKNGRLLPPVLVPIWPQRLILWQLIVIYVTSAWDKALGDMWIMGTAVNSALHHPHFARAPLWIMDYMAPISPAISYATLVFEFMWLALLIPARTLRLIDLSKSTIKRALIIFGIMFHGGIFALMDVGAFSWAMMVAYPGIMTGSDFDALRGFVNRLWTSGPLSFFRHTTKRSATPKITIFFDGICHLCQRSMFVLMLLDHLHRLKPIDFRDAELRKKTAPDLSLKDLDRALHIRLPSGKTYAGFDAFRVLAWHLPLLWPMALFLYVPGFPAVGQRMYARISANRLQCAEGICVHRKTA